MGIMKIHVTGAVLVVTGNHWGKGATKKEADDQLKRTGYKKRKVTPDIKGKLERVYYLFDCKVEELRVTSDIDVRWSCPPDTVCMKFEERF